MEDKQIYYSDLYFSTKRIELLMEELIFQQLITREGDLEKANEKFKIAMDKVNESLKTFINDLPPYSKPQ